MRILEEVDAAKREATEARALMRGLVTVGVLPTIAPYLLPEVLPGFSREFPGVEIVVQEDTTAQLLSLLAACELDLAHRQPADSGRAPADGNAVHRGIAAGAARRAIRSRESRRSEWRIWSRNGSS